MPARSIAISIPTAGAYMYPSVVGTKALFNLSHATAIILAFMCARDAVCTTPPHRPSYPGHEGDFRVHFLPSDKHRLLSARPFQLPRTLFPYGVLFGASSGCGRARRRYLCYLLFTLKTHQAATEPREDGQEPETPALSLSAALFTLSCITVVVAVCSECAALDFRVLGFQEERRRRCSR